MSLLTESKAQVEASAFDEAKGDMIRIEEVSVEYRVPGERFSTFKEYMIRRLQGRVKNRNFLALDQVNFTVSQGEVQGLIGKNGAGKSTLLKLVARVLKPTHGRVLVRGKVAPLLALGAGFHPELTGRENIFLNGALLGFSEYEMEAKFDNIVEFAGLREFIDAPMRTYSSGMWARLGFSVATDLEPDILIIDEVLAVGDEAFQLKSARRLEEFRERGTTILIVSHNMHVVKAMCTRVAWLDQGKIRMIGDPEEIVETYREEVSV